uniref:Uncharacterized protein n=1 Tax=Rhizophora mucronata TaxID=61149 RepID=A0A2P2LFX1_RHIMU
MKRVIPCFFFFFFEQENNVNEITETIDAEENW